MATPANLPSPPPDGDQNRGAAILVTETIFVSIGTLLVMLRFYVRSIIIRKFGLDDVFILLGLIFAIATLALDGLMVHYGVGRHQYYLSLTPQLLEQLSQAIKWQYISQPIVILSTMFTKISICFFLLRVFGTKTAWRRLLFSIMAFSTATNVSSAAIVLAQCQPVQKLWNPSLPGSCWNPHTEVAIGDYNGAVSVFCDWSLATVPIAFMWNLQMSLKLKVGICVLMGMGFFSGICAIVRTVLLKNLDAEDVTWQLVDLTIWAILEANVGIIAACIPALKPLFNPSLRYPWSSRGWSRKLIDDSAQQEQNEDRDRLHNAASFSHPSTARTAVTALPLENIDRSLVKIDSARQWSESDE